MIPVFILIHTGIILLYSIEKSFFSINKDLKQLIIKLYNHNNKIISLTTTRIMEQLLNLINAALKLQDYDKQNHILPFTR